jgi:hypothetical protein
MLPSLLPQLLLASSRWLLLLLLLLLLSDTCPSGLGSLHQAPTGIR